MDFAPDREELAWAAGFFDGEGHVGARVMKGRKWLVHHVDITQADPFVLQRFANAVGLGKVYGPYVARNKNPIFEFRVDRHERVQAICAMLWPWLSPIKRQQFRVALTVPLRRPLCEHHQIPSHCRECLRGPGRDRMRLWRLRKKEIA